MSSGNHIEERIACRLTRCECNLGGENRLAARRKLEPSIRRLHIGSEPEGTRAAHTKFSIAQPNPEMHFSAKRVEGAQVARAIRVDGDRVTRRFLNSHGCVLCGLAARMAPRSGLRFPS